MIEIERKFLVHPFLLPDLSSFECKRIAQGYLQSEAESTIRVRIANETAFLTIKGKSENLTRKEFEYEIPLDHAVELMKLCGDKVISKTRYLIPIEGKLWELDIFKEKLDGLLLTEIELDAEDEIFFKPDWVGKEVSLDNRFFNSKLSLLTKEESTILINQLSN